MTNITYNVAFDCQIKNLSSIYEKYFGYPSKGVFVEVGAFDGEMVSNTSCLSDHGWTGVYIEPVYQYYLRCVERHKNNKNVKVLNCAVGLKESIQKIYISDALSTMIDESPDMYRQIEVFSGCNMNFSPGLCEQYPLEKILVDLNIPKNFDILVVDVEGKESDVFRSFNLDFWYPKMMIVELSDNHPVFQNYKNIIEDHKKLREFILSKNYIEIYSDEINTIFIDKTFQK